MAKLTSYDLSKPGQKYGNLYDSIKSLGAWWHYLDSTWIVENDLACSKIRDRLKQQLHSNDRLLVVNLTGAWATTGTPKKGNEWLRQHL